MKPFCSGSRNDARLLQRLQKDDLTLAETNPFFFRQPLAPWVAARQNQRGANSLAQHVLQKIRQLGKRGKILLVEGSGGCVGAIG